MQHSISYLQPLALSVLDALPQLVMIAEQSGCVVMRSSFANKVLPHGEAVADVLRQGGREAIDWPAAMAMLPGSPTGLDFAGLSIDGREGRSLTVDVHLAAVSPSTEGHPQAEKGPLEGGTHLPLGGAARFILVLVTDVSARAALERRLLASERLAAVGELAAKVAHELNNPLDGVLRYVGLAQRTPDQAAGYLENARVGLMRMAGIVKDLLEQGHPRQGRFSASMGKLLQEAVAVMQPRAKAQAVAVELVVQEPALQADGNLFQVFCNIVKNALDAMPQGGRLSVWQRVADGQCTIEFADTGSGISPADAERVFEPFFTTKGPGEGSGLGLAVCREIVTRLGGSITAAGRREGGAVFTIHLPQQRVATVSDANNELGQRPDQQPVAGPTTGLPFGAVRIRRQRRKQGRTPFSANDNNAENGRQSPFSHEGEGPSPRGDSKP